MSYYKLKLPYIIWVDPIILKINVILLQIKYLYFMTSYEIIHRWGNVFTRSSFKYQISCLYFALVFLRFAIIKCLKIRYKVNGSRRNGTSRGQTRMNSRAMLILHKLKLFTQNIYLILALAIKLHGIEVSYIHWFCLL